ncbi:MAG: hypothetical protein M0D55_07975 [Elusimicrobiota bacterium]|nr:MAG: hypothetical protein M0D55_07975 [Elusimicrobiota bacterium]
MMNNYVSFMLVAAICFQTAACGTIIHPERRGQRGGRLDVGIVILDAIGLLFFIIPGVIAFAVDFSNGTIYLPGGGRGILSEVKFDKAGGAAAVEELLLARTGVAVKLDRSDVRIVRLDSLDQMHARFAAERVLTASRTRDAKRPF